MAVRHEERQLQPKGCSTLRGNYFCLDFVLISIILNIYVCYLCYYLFIHEYKNIEKYIWFYPIKRVVSLFICLFVFSIKLLKVHLNQKNLTLSPACFLIGSQLFEENDQLRELDDRNWQVDIASSLFFQKFFRVRVVKIRIRMRVTV